MTHRRRYILLSLCILTFLTLAPVLVLYISGQKIDEANGKIVRTGIVAVNALPKGAQVYIDDQPVGSAPLDARFIPVGIREIKIAHENYRPWQKKITIEAGRVTFLGETNRPLRLLPDTAPQIVADKVALFDIMQNGNAVFLQDNSLIVLDNNTLSEILRVQMPVKASKLMISADSSSALVQGMEKTWVLELGQLRWRDVSRSIPIDSEIVEFNKDKIYLLSQGQLKELSTWGAASEKTIAESVQAGDMIGGDLYFLQKKNGYSELNVASTATLEIHSLISELPLFSTAKLFLTQNRQAFIFSNRQLWRVDSTLNLIADNIDSVDISNDGLIVESPGEASLISVDNQSRQLLARSGDLKPGSIAISELGYCIAIIGDTLTALDLDGRDIRQVYQLARTANASQLTLAHDNRWLYWLDGNMLKRVGLK